MSPKIVDKKQKSKEISRAALKLFSLKGYAATSVGQIAKAASIGKGTVYEYFDTKKDIFIAAIMEWMSLLRVHLSKRLKEIKDPVARLRAMAEINTELINSVNPTDLRLSYLLKIGFIMRTSSGRKVSEAAFRHLGHRVQGGIFT